ncbi:hypothetical protein [Tenggerimyces flavus]|uniref:Secreted protein n=1 Tax=Tenggerimyces flavus TaxID=1708749 RepID=A0ABV7YDF4_9ACTN|nr:hypothetical protein [Tenggerimyces flavus]MBM7785975.1 hypothetical protein [Tenggerimyces flavus]
MRSSLARRLVTAVALVAGALLVAAPAQAAEQREAPAPLAIDVPTLPFVELPPTYTGATVDLARGDAVASAQLWKYRYDCGIGVSYGACNEVRGRYGYNGWPTSDIAYRPPGCTAPGVICPTYFFYYGH